MKRAILLGLGALGLAAAAIPAIALAQSGIPPKPPETFYGTAPSGAVNGQGVVAIVSVGGTSTDCGTGTVQPNPDQGNVLSYVVDVVGNDQTPGCGQAGATIQFYFTPPAPGQGGALALTTATWAGSGPTPLNITALGSALTRQGTTAQTAKDGTF